MFPFLHRLSLESKLFFSFVIFSTILLLLTTGTALYFDISRQFRSVDDLIKSSAAYISRLSSVQTMLKVGYPNPEVSAQMDALSEEFTDLNVILICNRDNLRFYHTSRHASGDSLVDGEETAILQGSEPYITTGYGTQGMQRRAFHAVTDSGGQVIGYVMTSTFTSGIFAHIRGLLLYFFLLLCASFLVALILSRGIVALLRRSLQGYHPLELLDLYRRQGTVLNAMEDGIVATNSHGEILFANSAACHLLGQQAQQLQESSLKDTFPDSTCIQVAASGKAIHNHSCVIHDHSVLTTEIPIYTHPSGTCSGVLTIFHDKTEMRKLSDELSGTKNMLDTLRFFNHEFMNKLHIILGYLQTGETQKAITFIMNTSLISSQSIRETANCIRVSALCALVIGKMMHAAELGIRLTVTPDSCCMDEDLLLNELDFVTIVGNLLENAIEELDLHPTEVKEIHLGIYCRSDCNVIVCEDTGSGISESLQPHIFQQGISSKGENRGLGLCLVEQIVTKYNGTIDLLTEAEAGTCFTITFTKEA